MEIAAAMAIWGRLVLEAACAATTSRPLLQLQHRQQSARGDQEQVCM